MCQCCGILWIIYSVKISVFVVYTCLTHRSNEIYYFFSFDISPFLAAHSFHSIQMMHFLLIKPNSVNIWFYQFMTDVTKFISGCMASLSAMIQLELPHVNILSKMDLVTKKRSIEEWALLPFTTFDNLYAIFIYFNDLIQNLFWCQFFESRASIFVIGVE